MDNNCLPLLGEITVATPLSSQIYNHGTGLHGFNHILCHQNRRLGTGNSRRGNNNILLGHHFGHQLPLATQKVFALLFGVATGAFGLTGIQIQFHRLGAYREYLLAGSGTHIVGLYHSTEALGGGTGLQDQQHPHP